MNRIVFAILGCLLFFSMQLSAQDRTVTGKVTADDGSELPGVTISIQTQAEGQSLMLTAFIVLMPTTILYWFLVSSGLKHRTLLLETRLPLMWCYPAT